MLPLERIPTLVAGLGLLALAATFVGLAPRDPLHRTFALFLFLRGLWMGLLSFSRPATDLEGRLGVYAILAIPFAAVAFTATYLHARQRRGLLASRRARWAVMLAALAAALVVEALYLRDHALFFGASGEGGPLLLFLPLTLAAYAALALVLAHGARRLAPGPRRSALLLVATGFAVEPLFQASFQAFDDALGLLRGVAAPADSAVLYLATCALSLAALARVGREGGRRGLARLAAAAPLVAALLAVLSLLILGPRGGFRPFAPLFVFDALFTLALVLLAAFSILKYELFGLELRVKAALKPALLAGATGALFFLLGETLESLAPSFLPGATGDLAMLAVAAAITIGLHPLHKAVHRVAERVMPGVAPTPEYRERHAADVYRMAFASVARDGIVTEEERRVLERLRERLALAPAAAAELERAEGGA